VHEPCAPLGARFSRSHGGPRIGTRSHGLKSSSKITRWSRWFPEFPARGEGRPLARKGKREYRERVTLEKYELVRPRLRRVTIMSPIKSRARYRGESDESREKSSRRRGGESALAGRGTESSRTTVGIARNREGARCKFARGIKRSEGPGNARARTRAPREAPSPTRSSHGDRQSGG